MSSIDFNTVETICLEGETINSASTTVEDTVDTVRLSEEQNNAGLNILQVEGKKEGNEQFNVSFKNITDYSENLKELFD